MNAFGVLGGSGNTLAADSSVSDVTTQPTVTHRYTGRPYDADLNLYDYRARWYEAQLGKFIQEDPIGLAAGDNNFYRYVGNNPLNLVDPSGLAATSNSTDHPRSIYDSIIDMSGLGSTGSSSSYNDDVWFGNLPSYSASQLAQPFQWSGELQGSVFNSQAESIWYQDYDNTPHWINQGRNQAFTRSMYGNDQAPSDTFGGMFSNELSNTAAWVNNGINSFAKNVANSIEDQAVNSDFMPLAAYSGFVSQGVRTYGAIGGGLISTAIDPVGTIGGSLASFDQNVQSIYDNARATGQSTSSALYQSLGYAISAPTGLNTAYESFTDQSTVTGQSYNRTLDQRASSFFFGVSQIAGTGAGVGTIGSKVTNSTLSFSRINGPVPQGSSIGNHGSGIANRIVKGTLSRSEMSYYRNEIKKLTGTKIKFGSSKNYFEYGNNTNVIHLKGKLKSQPRGVVFEELQHAIDYHLNPGFVKIDRFIDNFGNYKKANEVLHAGTFGRMSQNPLFKLSDAERADLMKQAMKFSGN